MSPVVSSTNGAGKGSNHRAKTLQGMKVGLSSVQTYVDTVDPQFWKVEDLFTNQAIFDAL